MSKTFELDQDKVLGVFDELVGLKVIHYAEPIVLRLVDEDFPFEFRICHNWSYKPLTVSDGKQPEPEAEMFGPGSDIKKSHEDQVLGHINDTHIVALNIYPAIRPQYLLLSVDSLRSQNHPMEPQDIAAAWKFLHSVDEPLYAMYNCTPTAGCSRRHKHIQVVPKPQRLGDDSHGFQFFPDADGIKVPYLYFIHRFEDTESSSTPTGSQVFEVYESLLKKCRGSLGIDEDDTTIECPHNVILVREWMVLIPRRSGNYKGLMVNAAGMMGMPTVVGYDDFQHWEKVGPARALAEFGVLPTHIKECDTAAASREQNGV